MKLRTLIAALAILALSACASTPQSPETAQAPAIDKAVAEAPAVAENEQPRQRCKRVKPIGSHRSQLVCQSAEQSAEESRRTQDKVFQNESTAPRVTVAPGGR